MVYYFCGYFISYGTLKKLMPPHIEVPITSGFHPHVKKHEVLTALDWDQALRYLHNILHKKPPPDLKVYLVTGATTYSVQLPMGENMEPIRYQFRTLTGLQSSLEGISIHHWAV